MHPSFSPQGPRQEPSVRDMFQQGSKALQGHHGRLGGHQVVSPILVTSPYTGVLGRAQGLLHSCSSHPCTPDTSCALWLRYLGPREVSSLGEGISLGLGATAVARAPHSQHGPDHSSGSACWAQAQRTHVWRQQETVTALPGCPPGGPPFWQRRPWH